MYSSLKRLNIPKKILTILVGSSIFTFKQTNFFSSNNTKNENKNNETFSNQTEDNTNNIIKPENPLKIQSNNSYLKDKEKDKDNNKDSLNLINMIYLPIQYSFFFFYETLSNKFAYCQSDYDNDIYNDSNNNINLLEKKKLYLGCSIRYSEELKGMRIINVKSDSPAEKSGLKVNDVILEIDGKEILGINDYKIAINSNKDNLKNFKIMTIDNKTGERIIENIKIYLEFEL
jgi:C-terminal processing protease CtpA/Prc